MASDMAGCSSAAICVCAGVLSKRGKMAECGSGPGGPDCHKRKVESVKIRR